MQFLLRRVNSQVFLRHILMEKTFKGKEYEFTVYGSKALFTDPVTRLGGEKCSYPFPTYGALRAIVQNIYWKPTIKWIIDEVRVMNKISRVSYPQRLMKANDMSTAGLGIYNYLDNVRYNVRAHFEWNEKRPDLIGDRNPGKHGAIFENSLKRGGRRRIYLGTSECYAYVEPCAFDEGKSFYDDTDSFTTETFMFHSYIYNDSPNAKVKMKKALWVPVMKNGVIKFPRPEECELIIPVLEGGNGKEKF